MSHQVALAFEDGVTRFIHCEPDQTVADASYRARINIPLDCRDGACGTCKAFCESGDYDGGTYIEDALTADESAQGYVLPCSMKPRADLVLQIASTSAIAKTQAATFEATITGLDRLSSTTVLLTLETPGRDQLVFLPGQYVNIAVPGTEESRSYSFSNAPDDKALTFLVKLTLGGVLSTWLTERASVGDAVTFTGPNGSFFLRETERPVLLLSGGTGLAPILAILRKLRKDGRSRPVHLVHGVSSDDDLVELDTLRDIAGDLPGFTWDHCVSDPASTAEHRGYVTALISPEHLYDGDVAVYLCGPPAMVESVRQHFASSGVEPTGFYYEKFALTGTAPAAEVETGDGEPVAGPMVLAFLAATASARLGRLLPPILAALVIGVGVVLATGRLASGSTTGPWLAQPVLQAPEFTWAVAVELVVPLVITVLVVQNGQGMAVLHGAGHRPPMYFVTIACGLVSLPAAAVGAISTCLTGPTNALLTASGAPRRHYAAAIWCGLLAIVFGSFAPGMVRLMLGMPEAFVAALGGLAMLRALQGAFLTAFSGRFVMGALVTFLVTVSDLQLLNIGSAFWGLVAGLVVARLVEPSDFGSR